MKKSSFLVILIVLMLSTAHAEIYKIVRPDGSVLFTDIPTAGAEKLDIRTGKTKVPKYLTPIHNASIEESVKETKTERKTKPDTPTKVKEKRARRRLPKRSPPKWYVKGKRHRKASTTKEGDSEKPTNEKTNKKTKPLKPKRKAVVVIEETEDWELVPGPTTITPAREPTTSVPTRRPYAHDDYNEMMDRGEGRRTSPRRKPYEADDYHDMMGR